MNNQNPHGQPAVPAPEDPVLREQELARQRTRPGASWMRFGAFLLGVLLCWLYAEFFATGVANGYDNWMKSGDDGHFQWTFFLGVAIVIIGAVGFVKTNGSRHLGVIASSALWLLIAFMPLCGAIVLFNQYLAR